MRYVSSRKNSWDLNNPNSHFKNGVKVSNGVLEGNISPPGIALAQYDAQAISGKSDGDAVSPWTDQLGLADATAGTAPTYKTDVLNSNPAVRFDGSSDYLTAAIGSQPQPVTFAVVSNLNGQISGNHAVVGGGSGEALHTYRIRQSEYQHFAGTAGCQGDTPTTNPELGVLIFDGANSKFRYNGTQILSGDIGSNDLVDLSLGRRSYNDQYFDGDIGEVVVYDGVLSDPELSDEEDRLANKWGITL